MVRNLEILENVLCEPEVSLCPSANLVAVPDTFLRLDLGSAVIFPPLFKPGHPPMSITPCPSASCRTITCADTTSHTHLPTHVCHILYFHSLLAFSLPVLCWFSPTLFFFTPGDQWLIKFSTFWLIALSPSSMGHCMKRLVILNFEAKCGKPPLTVSHHYSPSSSQSLSFVSWRTEDLVFLYLPFLTLVIITLGQII